MLNPKKQRNMRTKFFTTTLLLLGLNTSMVWATEVEPDVLQTIEIVSTGIPKGEPRHIVFSPIECYYNSGVLYFMFSNDIGNVEISVTSGTNTWMKTMETSDGMGEIPVSDGEAGSYAIEILTEYGECFVGRFTL